MGKARERLGYAWLMHGSSAFFAFPWLTVRCIHANMHGTIVALFSSSSTAFYAPFSINTGTRKSRSKWNMLLKRSTVCLGSTCMTRLLNSGAIKGWYLYATNWRDCVFSKSTLWNRSLVSGIRYQISIQYRNAVWCWIDMIEVDTSNVRKYYH